MNVIVMNQKGGKVEKGNVLDKYMDIKKYFLDKTNKILFWEDEELWKQEIIEGKIFSDEKEKNELISKLTKEEQKDYIQFIQALKEIFFWKEFKKEWFKKAYIGLFKKKYFDKKESLLRKVFIWIYEKFVKLTIEEKIKQYFLWDNIEKKNDIEKNSLIENLALYNDMWFDINDLYKEKIITKEQMDNFLESCYDSVLKDKLTEIFKK